MSMTPAIFGPIMLIVAWVTPLAMDMVKAGHVAKWNKVFILGIICSFPLAMILGKISIGMSFVGTGISMALAYVIISVGLFRKLIDLIPKGVKKVFRNITTVLKYICICAVIVIVIVLVLTFLF